MKTSFIYIVHPMGRNLQVEEQGGRVFNISGNRCPKGHGYTFQEMTAPMRNIATSIWIKGGELPLANIRLSASIPKKNISRVTEEIRKVTIYAPVRIGDVTVRHLLGAKVDVVMTRNILEA